MTTTKNKGGRPTKKAQLKARINEAEQELAQFKAELRLIEEQQGEHIKEDFSVAYRRYLDRVREENEKEAITHERAVAIIQHQAKLAPIDRVMLDKRGFGNQRPVFPSPDKKGNE